MRLLMQWECTKKLVTNACDLSKCVTPENINETAKESELADLEKIMDSFESEDRVIGTIVKCNTDSLYEVSDSRPRITLGNMNAVPVVNDNCSITPDSFVQTNTGTAETLTKDHNNNIILNTEAEGQSPCEPAGVTGKINSNTEPTDVNADREEQRKLAGVTPNTTVSIDIMNMTDLLNKNTRELERANTHDVQMRTSVKPVTPSNSTIMPSDVSAYNMHETTASSCEETMAPIGFIHAVPNHTPEDEPVLPDLVAEKPHNKDAAVEHATLQEVITGSNVTPNNTGEFDFPPISSDEENDDCPLAPLDSHEKESQLTEEEGDVVNTLLSFSRNLPSNGEDDTEITENSELMPIGKQALDVALVPIRFSHEDVTIEISRLNLHQYNNDVLSPQSTTTTTTMTTIITNKSGVILSPCNDETPSMTLASLTPKTTPKSSDDSPGSPHGNFRLRSYKLKKTTMITRNFPCKSCGAIKKPVQDLNDHHKRMHEQVMCGTSNKLFDTPLQLARHMYEHYEKTLKCDCCDQSFVFQSELDKHKINHRKNPSHKCMKPNWERCFFLTTGSELPPTDA